MAKYLVDSNVIIDALAGHGDARKWLAQNGKDCAVTIITRAETLKGYAVGDQQRAIAFMDQFEIVDIDKAVGDAAARVGAKTSTDIGRLKLPDALQAAAAQIHSLILVTRDEDFKKVMSNLIVPYQHPQAIRRRRKRSKRGAGAGTLPGGTR